MKQIFTQSEKHIVKQIVFVRTYDKSPMYYLVMTRTTFSCLMKIKAAVNSLPVRANKCLEKHSGQKVFRVKIRAKKIFAQEMSIPTKNYYQRIMPLKMTKIIKSLNSVA